MKINKYTLAALFIVVLSSLGVLLVIQFQILEKDIKNNQNMMGFAIPGILSDLYDNMMFNRDLDQLVRIYEGTESFQFSSDSNPTDQLQLVLKNGLDEVISLNYPDLKYQVDGFVSDEYGCMIHRGHRPELPKAQKVMEADNHMCFCMILPNTLDISMTYTNKEETVLGESANILKASFLLIAIILIAFWFTIRTIGKQKKLSDLKRDFINNLTHEFKTPIFSISLASKSLRGLEEVKKEPKADSYLNLISNETKRLQTQVDKILQMALLDSGNLTLDKKVIDLHESIQNVADGFKMIISEKKGSIKFNLNATKHQIVADETHLNNVLFNLIDNAQKYSDKNPDIEIVTEDAENNGVILTIKDHGIGMDQTTQKYVFDQFYRAQSGNVHTVKGFGLGLSYVKKIIEFHKGTISLNSEPGKGSMFKIFLPISS
ncbi:HAMP domain-containing sensor histidine kinase [Ekhidna sp.]|jgi:signal transduction histidine kinase|uniref:sensor histidine kinase n=1 Tax=Ekhidna sp. TaxID=2608089 RepID=UPI0032EA92F0